MRNPMSDAETRTLGTIVRDLSDDFRTLLRAEIALAKLELRQSLTGLGGAAAMFAAAAFLAAIGGALLIVTVILVLALWMPHWLASLIVTLLVLVLAVILVVMGKRRMQRTSLTPAATIESVKADVETVRSGVRRDQRGA